MNVSVVGGLGRSLLGGEYCLCLGYIPQCNHHRGDMCCDLCV